MTFTTKKLELTITLGTGEFGAQLGDSVTLSDFRMMAELENPGGESMGVCQLRVFGLRQDVMNKLTTIGQVNRAFRIQNKIALAAGDDESGMQVVFQGIIYDAWAGYEGAPDVAFNILAYAGFDLAVKPVGATSYKGPTSAAQVFADLATVGGYVLENNGVDVNISSPYLVGSTLEKIRELAAMAGVHYVIDREVLAIWPRDASRSKTVPKVSPDTGMVGYPALSSKGMTVKMLFNWNINLGADVEVQSSIPMACGTYRVFNVSHSLSCNVANGPWFTTMECFNVKQ